MDAFYQSVKVECIVILPFPRGRQLYRDGERIHAKSAAGLLI
jgi:hypothetical protein